MKEKVENYDSSDNYMSIYTSITNRMCNRLGQGVVLFYCCNSNDHIEDSAELFIALFLYNLLIYTFFLRKVPMVLTKFRSWLDTHKIVPETVRNQTIAAFNGVEQNGD